MVLAIEEGTKVRDILTDLFQVSHNCYILKIKWFCSVALVGDNVTKQLLVC
jgi:hypothetical protein